jgi:porphobilinogen deaminase
MLAFRKDIELIDLQGNIPDWLKAIRDGKYDAILLASSDIDCLELALDDLHVEKLDPHEFIPAPAQGVMAIQIRKTDTELFEALQRINKKHVQQQIAIERKILTLFEGSNKVIVNAYGK